MCGSNFYESDVKVLIFCVEFRELYHLTCDLSQAEWSCGVINFDQEEIFEEKGPSSQIAACLKG